MYCTTVLLLFYCTAQYVADRELHTVLSVLYNTVEQKAGHITERVQYSTVALN